MSEPSAPKLCDHTSVGMLVWHNDSLLLIERRKFPFGFAPPAGHVDGDPTFEAAAERELKEEVGLDSAKLELLLDERRDNPCRRPEGTWHHWKIYRVDATGQIDASPDETRQARFYTQGQIKALADKTVGYLDGQISESDWEAAPGIEPVWYNFFRELKII